MIGSSRVYAIGDLHLSGFFPKPMEKFGAHWAGHWETIQADWLARVRPEDIVLIPGDISWAMHLWQAQMDLDQIGLLPGQKVLLRGNHDYWWSSISRIRESLPPGLFAIQNDAMVIGEYTLCGSRGWTCSQDSGPEDIKLFKREVQRMELSLKHACKIKGSGPLIAMIHFPPFNERQEDSQITELFEAYGVESVVYGHLHSASLRFAFNGVKNGIAYRCVSCDGLDFRLATVYE